MTDARHCFVAGRFFTPASGVHLMIRVAVLVLFATVSTAASAGDWKTIWDGKSMAGWKASENADSWSVADGTLKCAGPRSHLFYVGDDQPFENFEFECDVKTTKGSNAGIYFHTKYQESGWPKYGYECQVNISHGDPKKSGSLYGVVDVGVPEGLKDDEWYKTRIKVEGRHVTITINDQVTVNYTEPKGKDAFSKDFERRLGSGTFALQAHDPKSVVYFRNLKVRRLP
jgi:3-keto-disaccharide hydrolase